MILGSLTLNYIRPLPTDVRGDRRWGDRVSPDRDCTMASEGERGLLVQPPSQRGGGQPHTARCLPRPAGREVG